MPPDEGKGPAPETATEAGEAQDKAGLELAREVFHLLSHAVTSLKLYPSQHATVVKFVDELHGQVRAYLADREMLEVDVQEQAFLMKGEPIFKEEHLPKSLPYLFHKDGMQKFAILKDIDKDELRDLLEVIRKTSLLPFEESDIVISIWEKDFANVRIFAPDEYLLSKIDIFTRQPYDFFIDRQKLYSGQIELSADDLNDIQAKRVSLGLLEQEESPDYTALVTTLEDKERDLIESMLVKFRESPPEIEFHDMIFELLTLENRPERVAPILEFLERHHRELIQDGKFSHAVQFLRQTQELRELFADDQPEKAAALDKFLNEITGEKSVDLIRESIERQNFDSLSALLEVLGFLGGRSADLASQLLDEIQEPGTRRSAADYLEEISQDNIDILADQLRDGRPAITREIITLLGRDPSKKALSYLATLATYTNKEIKLAAVETLGSSPAPLAQRILFTFVQDKDEDIAAAAADRLRWPGDKDLLKRIIKMVSSRLFRGLGPKLRIAVLSFLVRAGTPEALGTIRKAIEKSGLFARASRHLTRLCAVEALARVATPEALEILGAGAKNANKKISEACRRALETTAGPKASDRSDGEP